MSAAFDPPAGVVREVVERALSEDLGVLGDLTGALIPEHAFGSATFVARAPGVLAGTACATEVFARINPAIDVEWHLGDGTTIDARATIGRVAGPLRSMLTAERTALNLLCHLSGVATLTRHFVDATGGRARIWDTRKTTPGLRALEKAAVRAGGGANHRGSLSDMVLVKDNHLAGIGVTDAVKRARELWPGRTVEVECDRQEQVQEAVAAGADIVMLDNMTPERATECVQLVRASPRPDTLIEVSGGVTLDNVAAYSQTGADMLSTSAITQSAPALDIALDVAV